MGSELFFNYLKFEKRYSEHTLRAYIDDINQFYTFHQKRDPGFDFIKNPDYKYIRSWIVGLTNTGHNARTINRKLSSLKKFTKYLISSGQMEKNPFEKIISPKLHKKIPSFLNVDETNLLKQEQVFQNDFVGKRDMAIMELFYCTGIRLSELINLKSADIDFSSCTIKVIGKRNKERIIPFHASLTPVVKIYLEEKFKLGLVNEFLFTTDKGEKTYPRLIQRIVKRYLSLVTTNENKNPHILRHTFATHLLNNGADINAIKELLGHANLSATQIYTHNTFQKLNRIYKQAHPRA
jgi:integrase/recombinase XerC